MKVSTVPGDTEDPDCVHKGNVTSKFDSEFESERAANSEQLDPLDQLILPSDEQWRHRVYYTLVQLQREGDADSGTVSKRDKGRRSEEAEAFEPKEQRSRNWLPDTIEYPLKVEEIIQVRSDKWRKKSIELRSTNSSMTEACIEPGWRVTDLLLAGKVLQKSCTPPTYADETEMRRVFGLVYDVLRYKDILTRVLRDVGFWCNRGRSGITNQLAKIRETRERLVWLLLYDMQGRKFARFGDLEAVRERKAILEQAGMQDIEEQLLEVKTHLAASVSRLRIGGSALNFDELLPAPLRRMRGVSWQNAISLASGWINTAKIATKEDFLAEMSQLGFIFRENRKTVELDEYTYTFDPFCPKVVLLPDRARERLSASSLVREHRFIFLERSLCLGSAAVAQAIRVSRLCGPVVLTHAVAPRHTGYLAGLLADIEDARALLVFGTGDRRSEYENYLKDLGVSSQECRIFSETYASIAAESVCSELERTTIILASPPSTYTGLKDVVDLAVARTGDTDLLETLTNLNGTRRDDPEAEARRAILTAEQESSLKYALTKPNVQFLVYEVHTTLPAESTEMVRQVVDYANRLAAEKHLRDSLSDQSKKGQSAAKCLKSSLGKVVEADNVGRVCDKVRSQDSQVIQESNRCTASKNIIVPDTDVFEIRSIDGICGENAVHLLDPGCFLAIIKRKKMMQFDSPFMIEVAESKGLFGDRNQQQQSRQQQQKLKIEPMDTMVGHSSQTSHTGTKRIKIEIERITAPTYSWLLRTKSGRQNCQVCVRQVRGTSRRKDRVSSMTNFYSNDRIQSAIAHPSTRKKLYPCHIKRLEFPLLNAHDPAEKFCLNLNQEKRQRL